MCVSQVFTRNALWKSGTFLNEVILRESAVHKRLNKGVHNNVHQAEIQYVQFMNNHSLNAFRQTLPVPPLPEGQRLDPTPPIEVTGPLVPGPKMPYLPCFLS